MFSDHKMYVCISIVIAMKIEKNKQMAYVRKNISLF